MSKTNVIKKDTFHYKWSKTHKPVLSIKPGDKVHFEVNEVTSWQVTKKSRAEDLGSIDNSKLYPLAGPVFVEGARRGDALIVDIERVEPAEWGWTGIVPGLGLLEEFVKPYLFTWKLKTGVRYANFLKGIKVALNPFCGVNGVAPPEDGFFDALPPGKHGGNMDIRNLTAGSRLLLPVWNEGALFSTCDMHATQGDGEVCVTAIECPGNVTITFDLMKNANLKSPVYYSRKLRGQTNGYVTATGIAPDLMYASKEAVRGMISQLERAVGLSAEQAYVLCSVMGELRIHEVVDQPNWVVGMMMPQEIFKGSDLVPIRKSPIQS